MNKKISVGLAIALALIAMTVTFSVTFVLSQQRFTVTVNSVREREKMYSKLAEIDKYVRDTYYGEINDDNLLDLLAAGYILGTEDKNASYYTAKQYAELVDIQNGKLVSIGVEVVKDASGYARITKVYRGSPAEEVGLQKNDFITRIDDIDVKSMTCDAVMAKLRGEEGTSVTLSFLDSMNVTTEGLEIQRRKFDATTVDFQMLANTTTGYIKISSFNNSTPSDFDSAVRQLMDKGATGLVFDLRGNAGGVLSAAVKCIDILCPEGVVAQAKYKNGTIEPMGESDENQVDLPMVVLVNKETASAAELFAAELREFGKAKIVGGATYGKGTIQREPYRLSDGSAVVVTIAALLTGEGDSFDGAGLTPDVESVLKAEDEQLLYVLALEQDPQVIKALDVLNAKSSSSNSSSSPEPSSQPEGGEGGDSELGEDGDSAPEGGGDSSSSTAE